MTYKTVIERYPKEWITLKLTISEQSDDDLEFQLSKSSDINLTRMIKAEQRRRRRQEKRRTVDDHINKFLKDNEELFDKLADLEKEESC